MLSFRVHGLHPALILVICSLGSKPGLALAADPELGLIVRLRASASAQSSTSGAVASPVLARVEALVADLGPSWSRAFPAAGSTSRLLPRLDLSAVYVLHFPDAARRAGAAARLADDPDVLYVEPVFQILAPASPPPGVAFDGVADDGDAPSLLEPAVTPGDSLYPLQWGLARIGMPEVWKGGTGTPGILVGVVDTGIETRHFDLAPNLARNPLEESGVQGVDDDGNGYVDDVLGWNTLDQSPDIEDGFGHGSHIAGIIGAASDGVRGTVGVTWEVGLLPVRMFNNGGRGTNLAGAQGIVYAAERGAHIINMSWGTTRLSRVIRDAVEIASASGAVLVASAGNAGPGDSGKVLDSFPAAFDQVITVGATTITDGSASFSNRGPRVDVTAPGVDILSTTRGGHFALMGTSQSAAFVSGLAAHLLYRHPHLGAEEVRSILRLAALDLGRQGWDPIFGAGRIEAPETLLRPSAPVAVIRDPRTLDATGAAIHEVQADAMPGSGWGGGTTFVLDVGEGSDPLQWSEVATGKGGVSSHLGTLDLKERVEGELTVRLRVQDTSGREAEDRVLFRVDRTDPVLLARNHLNRLAGRRFEQLIRYESNERVTGRVRTRQAGSGLGFMDIVSEEAAASHTADLRNLASLFPGRHEYAIELTDLAGRKRRFDSDEDLLFTHEVLPILDVPSNALTQATRLENFELGAVADLDGDGRPELLGEARVATKPSGEPEGRLTVMMAGSAWPKFEIRFQGSAGLPLAAGDVDGDGSLEVLVGEENSATLLAGILEGSPHSLWTTTEADRLWGGTIVDADRDGQVEILFPARANLQPVLFERLGNEFIRVDLGLTVTTGAAGFAVGDYDGDGRGEIAFGSSSGELVVLEASGAGFIETVREPFLGGVANALVAADLGDADGDGRPEFAISAVGVISDREDRPVMGVFEAVGNDQYEVVSQVGFRDKNFPYDNWLAAGDADGDGRPEVAVAHVGDVYLLEADRDDRFLPGWYAERGGGGRVFVADLDADGEGEILVSERRPSGPVTTIYSRPTTASPSPLAWTAVLHPLGNEIRWEPSAGGESIFDLAIYRLGLESRVGREGAEGPLESDLLPQRIAELPGEITGAGSFRDLGTPPGDWRYALGYTVDDGEVRRRILDRARLPVANPAVPVVGVRPNPAPPDEISISLIVAEPGPVRVAIVDVTGRVRRELLAGPLSSGRHVLAWDGRGAGGQQLASGVYFVRVALAHREHAARFVLIR